ncbi:ADP-ribosyl cyclase/cyclic ADP-ribose hydrolase 1 isoform X4 [Conger conger]|uniref:ADP-ribosyl cyclase/cyclic ADP-ribose hydrolase 1 isoform X4 n=1 Tax=Conger conger TaxID=82655 RepID=UPI002A5ADC2A|nr:ADP-ribosyl cyclase/cyclic ADP-ribose hydrolase 1 isoform X4 [Conger conger]
MNFDPFSVKASNMIGGLVILFFLPKALGAEMGTTDNLKEIVIGRCYNYVTLVNPSSRYDCEEIWGEFQRVVLRRKSCGVAVRDYHRLFHSMMQTLPCDRLLFWSKTHKLVHSYSAVTRHFWTLEDTLVGYMFNDLIWCGQDYGDPGFNFSSCPVWSTCVNHPVYSLWKQASENHVWKRGARQPEPSDGEPRQHQGGGQPGGPRPRILLERLHPGPHEGPSGSWVPLDLY